MPGSYLITEDGVISNKYVLVNEGKLENFICENQSKYHEYLPTIKLINNNSLFIESKNILDLKEIENGIYVNKILSLKTQDYISGDFSLKVSESIMIKNGYFCGLVTGTISGNIFDILKNDSTLYINIDSSEHLSLSYEGKIV